jgi:phosphatidylserine/phosphatidylglycerophosphate/cardiolipin synthase-like enzyme
VRLTPLLLLLAPLALGCGPSTIARAGLDAADQPTDDAGDIIVLDGGGVPTDTTLSLPHDAPGAAHDSAAQQDSAPLPTAGITIIVEPSDNATGLVNAIKGATSSVHMTMYLISSTPIINALINAKSAGRDVKVVLNETFPTGTTSSNASVFTQLQNAGISVKWAPSTFTLTHEKCVIIDGKTAWIMTMNATASSATDNREYLAVDTIAADVAEAEAIFEADYAGSSITPTGSLVVSPTNARTLLVALASSATSTIDMEAEELSDTQVVSAMASAAGRGVTVKIVLSDGTPSSAQSTAVTQLKNAGAHLVSVSSPYIHAKSMVVDGTKAYVGSMNFTTASLVYNRELGVIFSIASEVQKVLTTTRSDFLAGAAL